MELGKECFANLKFVQAIESTQSVGVQNAHDKITVFSVYTLTGPMRDRGHLAILDRIP